MCWWREEVWTKMYLRGSVLTCAQKSAAVKRCYSEQVFSDHTVVFFFFCVLYFFSGEISHVKEVNKPRSVLLKGSPCSMEAAWSHCIYFVALCCYLEQRTLDQDVAWAKDLNCSLFVYTRASPFPVTLPSQCLHFTMLSAYFLLY